MRILSSAVVLAALTCSAGCGDKSDAVQTTPPAQTAKPAAAAPAPAAAAPAPAGGRQGGAAAAPITVAEHAATMKTIAQSV
ncbi:MAG TPA: hypothetical protein VM819_09905, partial [Vicinamibacterales bacterium]|nr:hypothetical protein [Vicinamibacterales bacterium]